MEITYVNQKGIHLPRDLQGIVRLIGEFSLLQWIKGVINCHYEYLLRHRKVDHRWTVDREDLRLLGREGGRRQSHYFSG
jgi:hypothetical protein